MCPKVKLYQYKIILYEEKIEQAHEALLNNNNKSFSLHTNKQAMLLKVLTARVH